MKKQIKFLMILMLVIFAQVSLAGGGYRPVDKIDKEKLNLIVEYMRLLKADLLVRTVMTNEIANIRQAGTEVDEAFESKLISVFSRPDVIVGMYAPIYDKYLSSATLKGSVEFLGSEVGRKTIALLYSGDKEAAKQMTASEQKEIKEFKESEAWKDIVKQTPLISRDAASFSRYLIADFLSGKYNPSTANNK